MYNYPACFSVVGTDTGVGKTVVASRLLKQLNGTYWKPIQSGSEEITDTNFVRKMTGLPSIHFLKEKYILKNPLAPPQAAAIEKVRLSLDVMDLPKEALAPLIIEGVGGVYCPVTEDKTYVDLLQKWQIPVVLVARSTLGTINHTLLSLKALRDGGIEVLGVILNGPKNPRNKASIEKMGKVSILEELDWVYDLQEVVSCG